MKLLSLVLKKGSDLVEIYDEKNVVKVKSKPFVFYTKDKNTTENYVDICRMDEFRPFDLRIKLGGTFALLTFFLKNEQQIEYLQKRLLAYCKEHLGF